MQRAKELTAKALTAENIRMFLGELIATLILGFIAGLFLLQFQTLGADGSPLISRVNQFGAIFGPFAVAVVYAGLHLFFGDYASAHMNPAISLAAFIRGRLSIKQLIINLLAQMIGGAIGVLAVKAIFQGASFYYPGFESILATIQIYGLNSAHVALFEAIAVFFPVLGLMLYGTQSKEKAAGAIALGLIMGIAIAQPFTGAVLNPAFVAPMQLPLIYFFAPCLGSVLAVLVSLGVESWGKFKLVLSNDGKKK